MKESQFVVIYNVDGVYHRFTFNDKKVALANYEKLANVVRKCDIKDGIVSFFDNREIQAQVEKRDYRKEGLTT